MEDSLTSPERDILRSMTEGRKHFSAEIPGHQTAWDSTSLGEFKTCPRSYFYSHILGLRGRGEAVPLTFGIHYHKALEYYDHGRFSGHDHETAVHEVVKQICLDMRVEKSPEHVDEDGEVIPAEFGFWQSPDNRRSVQSLIRSVIWYMDQFEHDPLITIARADGSPMVELSFRMELSSLVSLEGKPYLLCGHLDRMVHFPGQGNYFLDRKSTISGLSQEYFHRYSPDNQMSLYSLASKIVFDTPVLGGIIDAAQTGVNFTRFQRGFVTRTAGQTDEWVNDLGLWLKQAEQYAERAYWPQNDKSCSMYGGCKYQSVCAADPGVRGHRLNSLFAHQPWNPLEAR